MTPEDPPLAETAPGRPGILRVTAPNPGPMTLAGTNTYVVGRDPAWIIDPGPADEAHIATVRAAADERGGVGGVVLTHSHADHSAGVEMLGEPLALGAVGDSDESGAFAAAWEQAQGPLPANADQEGEPALVDFAFDARIGPFEVLPTAGHARDHVSFILDDEAGRVLFCGDLILGEGSSIVPPRAGGGSLADYMNSLDFADDAGADLLCPGHGPWITDPAAKIADYREHRLERERKLVAALESGERDRDALLDAAWDDVPAELRPAAALAMQAHLEKLAAEGRIPPAS